MSENTEQLKYEMRQHAYDMLAVNTVREYENQIGEWQKYINRVVDAEKDAIANHQKVLNEMAAEEKAKAEANAILCMFALSLVTGPFLSWVGGAIQYNVMPKLIGKTKTTIVTNVMKKRGQVVDLPIGGYFTQQDHNKIVAKMFGDFAQARTENVGSGIMSFFSSSEKQQLPNRVSGNSFQQLTSFAQQTSSIDQLMISLKTTLENAMIDETTKTVNVIIDRANAIKRHLNYGKLILEEMYQKNPQTKKLSGIQLKWAAYKYVEELVDIDRKKWAINWLYYGYNPPNISMYEMSRMIEREIWALWILDQDFQIIKYEESKSTREGEVTIEYTKNKGRDKLPFGNILLKRLAYLNITEARNMQELAVNTIHKVQMQSEKFNPVSGITGTVDEENELNKIKEWAINHPRLTFTSPDNVSFRTVPSISQYFKQ